MLIGVVLSVAYLRTRALWLPWGIHFAWNATLGLVFGLPVSGIRLFNVVVTDDGYRSAPGSPVVPTDLKLAFPVPVWYSIGLHRGVARYRCAA